MKKKRSRSVSFRISFMPSRVWCVHLCDQPNFEEDSKRSVFARWRCKCSSGFFSSQFYYICSFFCLIVGLSFIQRLQSSTEKSQTSRPRIRTICFSFRSGFLFIRNGILLDILKQGVEIKFIISRSRLICRLFFLYLAYTYSSRRIWTKKKREIIGFSEPWSCLILCALYW